jgi:hypothetical protein
MILQVLVDGFGLRCAMHNLVITILPNSRFWRALQSFETAPDPLIALHDASYMTLSMVPLCSCGASTARVK